MATSLPIPFTSLPDRWFLRVASQVALPFSFSEQPDNPCISGFSDTVDAPAILLFSYKRARPPLDLALPSTARELPMMQSAATQYTAITTDSSRDATPESSSPPLSAHSLHPPTPSTPPSTSPAPPAPVSAPPAGNSPTGRRPRSFAWLHFVKAPDYATSKKASCKYCNKTLKACRGSTSSIRAHLKRHHPRMVPKNGGPTSSDR